MIIAQKIAWLISTVGFTYVGHILAKGSQHRTWKAFACILLILIYGINCFLSGYIEGGGR